jgi:ribosomal protein S18 acetylase RimI-like enzyme
MNAWPSLQTVLYDGWVIRMANGYTKRANSVNPLYQSAIGLDEKIAYCKNLFTKRSLPVIYKLVECEAHKNIDKRLEALQYEQIDITSVQINNDIKTVAKIPDGIIINNDFSGAWIDGLVDCNNINIKHVETIKLMLKNITGETVVVHKEIDGEFAGCGFGVIENGYVGIFDIVVKESRRGHGYGEEIVQSILSQAGKAGAERSYLQVVNKNTIAKNLYKKLGYTESYKYWYRQMGL